MSLFLKEIREEAKLTQLELAERMSQALGEEMSQVQISRYESDPDSVPLRRAMCWLAACGVSLDEASRLGHRLPQVKPLDLAIPMPSYIAGLTCSFNTSTTRVLSLVM